MVEDAQSGTREACGIDQARMGKFVQNDHIVPGHKAPDGTQGGRKAGGEGKGSRLFLERCDRILKIMVRTQRAANQPRGTGSNTESFNRPDSSLLQGGFIREAQIVIGREIEQGATLGLNFRALRRVDPA